MIVFRTPKGWTCPPEIDGKKCEDYWRSHQVPMGDMDKPEHIQHPRTVDEELPARGAVRRRRPAACPSWPSCAPTGHRRMSDNPHANGGLLLRDLQTARLPRLRRRRAQPRRRRRPSRPACMGKFLRDVMKLNLESQNFRLFSPDENNSNRWQDVLEVTNRCYMAEIYPDDDHLSPDGRVMEVLSEHQCQGWLEGYLLTGRHGFFSCYEAFIHIIDSMFNQHAKWLKVVQPHPLAAADRLAQLLPQLARLAAGPQRLQPPGSRLHRPRRQQEGRGHPRLPAARRQLPALGDRPLPAQPQLRQRRRRRQAAGAAVADDGPGRSSTAPPGIGIWEWASNDKGGEPDVVMACCGDVPTLETLAAVDLLRKHLPELKVRVDQRRRPDEAAAAERAPARAVRPRLRRPVHQGQADHLRLPRLPVADPSADLPARRTTRTCTSAATRKRARRPRRSTWCVLNDLDRFHLVRGRDRPPAAARRRAPPTSSRRSATS